MQDTAAAQDAYRARVRELTAQVEAGELEIEEATTILHAARYPEGCRIDGHHCEACMSRLGQTPHRTQSVKVGARPFYAGTWKHRCLEQGCGWSA